MDPGIIAVFIPIIAVSGVFTLIGMKIHYSHLEDTRVGSGARQEVEQLTESVENLRADVELMRNEFLELNERMDFTERLLERPKTEE